MWYNWRMNIRYILIALVVVVGGFFAFNMTQTTPRISDVKNAEYTIQGQKVKLQNGVSTATEAGSESKIVTRYFGDEVHHDLNDDGREDTVFLLTQTTGGTGTFFYVVAGLNTVGGYVGSEAYLLGDRIAPQTTEMDEGKTALGTNRKNVIVVNYAERKAGEPMTAKPSVGKSVWLKLNPDTLRFGEVAQNFEGEAR